MMPAPNVLFVGGYGRSGSTLFEAMLAQSPEVVAVGELRHIWERGIGQNERCGCGRSFSECPFWSGVIGEVCERTSARPEELGELWRRVDRIRFIPGALGLSGFPPSRSDRDRYLQVLRSLYCEIGRASGASVIVDSSKEVSSGVLSGLVDAGRFTYVQLVRDPRAVAHSWARRRRRPEVVGKETFMPRVGPVQASWQWNQRAAAGELMRRWKRGAVVRYEDLVGDPDQEVGKVLRIVGLEGGGSILGSAGQLRRRPTIHSVAGNPMRFTEGDIVPRLDDSWRIEMPRSARLKVTTLTWPGLLRYGYHRT
jgi:hypothetical protein